MYQLCHELERNSKFGDQVVRIGNFSPLANPNSVTLKIANVTIQGKRSAMGWWDFNLRKLDGIMLNGNFRSVPAESYNGAAHVLLNNVPVIDFQLIIRAYQSVHEVLDQSVVSAVHYLFESYPSIEKVKKLHDNIQTFVDNNAPLSDQFLKQFGSIANYFLYDMTWVSSCDCCVCLRCCCCAHSALAYDYSVCLCVYCQIMSNNVSVCFINLM